MNLLGTPTRLIYAGLQAYTSRREADYSFFFLTQEIGIIFFSFS